MSININWIDSLSNGINENVSDVMKYRPYLWEGSPYYISYYVCPHCNDMLLYKMRSRGATTMFHSQPVTLFNIFTCPVCKKFYASVSTGSYDRTARPLNEYALVSQSYSDYEYKNKLIETLSYANG